MINIDKLSKEDIELLRKHFLENRIIKLNDILQPIEEYFWKFDLNANTQSYELYLGIPKDWLHDMTFPGYKMELVNETENGKIVKFMIESDDYMADLDDLILYAIDVMERNTAILSKIKEKEVELQIMKDRMVEVQMELDREIEILKTIKNGEIPATEEDEDEIVEEPTSDIIEKPVLSKEEADKFVELITNGKK